MKLKKKKMEADQSQFKVETEYCFKKYIWHFASFDVSLQNY